MLNQLGNNLHKNRDLGNQYKASYHQSNDDFIILLELIKQKKKLLKEVNPYYFDKFSFKKEMLYETEKNNSDDDNHNTEFVEDYISEFLT